MGASPSASPHGLASPRTGNRSGARGDTPNEGQSPGQNVTEIQRAGRKWRRWRHGTRFTSYCVETQPADGPIPPRCSWRCSSCVVISPGKLPCSPCSCTAVSQHGRPRKHAANKLRPRGPNSLIAPAPFQKVAATSSPAALSTRVHRPGSARELRPVVPTRNRPLPVPSTARQILTETCYVCHPVRIALAVQRSRQHVMQRNNA